MEALRSYRKWVKGYVCMENLYLEWFGREKQIQYNLGYGQHDDVITSAEHNLMQD